ncbi:MAG: FAD:protein FMN transferase [Candidatus Pacebacteria bacterium]|nr:FAD:protein FMN transferase [Candidatus Paceibacterota bacterium]
MIESVKKRCTDLLSRASIAVGVSLCILLVLFLWTITRKSPNLYVREFTVFGTYARLTFYAQEQQAEKAADAIQERLQELNNRINIFDDQSELSQLNRTAHTTPFQCSEPLWTLLSVCRQAYERTNGAFDISVGPLLRLWGFHEKRDRYPAPQDVQQALAAVGLNEVVFTPAERSVRFTHPDSYLDFGGVAKGYGLDLAVRVARKHGIERGIIDLGGNVYCFPLPPPGKDVYTVAIRDPFHPNAFVGKVHLLDQCVATSGNYENKRTLNGRLVHHIIDPRTGYPVPHVASVTVITPQGVDSDIFATAVFVAGMPLAKDLCRETPRTGILRIVQSDKGRTAIETCNWPGSLATNCKR